MALAHLIRLIKSFIRTAAETYQEPAELRRLMSADASLEQWHTGRYQSITGGFYKSQAMEWKREWKRP